MVDHEARAEALRSLASLLGAGLTTSEALQRWPDTVPEHSRADFARAGRRVRLGMAPAAAIRGLQSQLDVDAEALAGLVAVCERVGGDVAAAIRRLAVVVERRAAQHASAGAATAGAKLSGRLIGGLPAGAVLLVPVARAPVWDAVGLLILGLGAAATAAGIAWIKRLTPCPPAVDDAASVLADLLSCALRGGATCSAALHLLSNHAPADIAPDLKRVQRNVVLGATWVRALCRSGSEGLRGLGDVLARADATGLPVADELTAFAERRREDAQFEFEKAVRKAPIWMVLPLVLCILPGFVLLALAPFLRALSLH